MMRERTLGNSVTQLYKKLMEQHSEAFTRRVLQYLTACEPFTRSSLVQRPVFAEPPLLPALPKPKWLLAVYARDVLGRLHEVKAKITSVLGCVLKMDSTKKVFFSALFISRNAAGVNTEAHPLYGIFMARLSACIFLWDPEDVAALRRAKEAELAAKKTGHISERAIGARIARRELALHCRRRTRGLEETTESIGSLIDLFDSAHGKDTLGVPLLDHERIQQIWKEQRKHIQCIQDPENFPLYMKTGTLKKGGVELCCYRCARGSTSLESFHLHLNRFIPGITYIRITNCHINKCGSNVQFFNQ